MMEEYLKKIFNNDMDIVHGIYEPPNQIPILRYMINKKGYKVILLGNEQMNLSCLNWLATENIKPEYIFYNIDDLDMLDNSFNYFLILTDSNYKSSLCWLKLIEKMNNNNIKDYLCPYDFEKIPRHDNKYLKYIYENEVNIIKMLNMLHDEESKRIYVEYIRTKLYADFYRLEQRPTWEKYFDSSVYRHLNDEIFINCGSSNGDSIFYYLEKFGGDFSKIYALEADDERVKQFQNNLKYIEKDYVGKIENLKIFVDNNYNKMDVIFDSVPVSLINMDIEGMELDSLKGAKKLIELNRPVVAACAYHEPTDLYELPMFFKNISDDYSIFYRKYASTFRNKHMNSELVMYAVPQKRLVK